MERGPWALSRGFQTGFNLQMDEYDWKDILNPKYLFSLFVFVWVNGELKELCAKFWNFWIDIHKEIICQSWLLLTTFFNFPIVHCALVGFIRLIILCEKVLKAIFHGGALGALGFSHFCLFLLQEPEVQKYRRRYAPLRN